MRKNLSEIEGLELFHEYEVDSDGYIVSHKGKTPRILKPYWTHCPIEYRAVQIYDEERKRKIVYIHRLVAQAFIPNPTNSWGVRHKSDDHNDNSIDNLEWTPKQVYDSNKNKIDANSLILSPDISDYIKLVHRACLEKGVPVPNEYDFYHTMIETSLNEYINRYGLKKTIHQIRHTNQLE